MCTAMSILSKQNEMFLGRTMDFYHDLDLELYRDFPKIKVTIME